VSSQILPRTTAKGLEAFTAYSSHFAMTEPSRGGDPRPMGLTDVLKNAVEVESQGGEAPSQLLPDANQAGTPTPSLTLWCHMVLNLGCNDRSRGKMGKKKKSFGHQLLGVACYPGLWWPPKFRFGFVFWFSADWGARGNKKQVQLGDGAARVLIPGCAVNIHSFGGRTSWHWENRTTGFAWMDACTLMKDRLFKSIAPPAFVFAWLETDTHRLMM